mmetsp:Transcript_5223/g.8051  ORF Transcript_5223/g.8051 Transcript_5223/m.8051 type:complete len:390 (-) Transcript_5223:925-2094(-)
MIIVNLTDWHALAGGHIPPGGLGDDANHFGDCLRGVGVVPSDHDYLDPGRLARADGPGNRGAGGVDQCREPDEGVPSVREVGVDAALPVPLVLVSGLEHVRVEALHAEREDALAVVHQSEQPVAILGLDLLFGLLLPVDEHVVAPLPDPLGRPLHPQDVLAAHVADVQHELVGGVERQLVHRGVLPALLLDPHPVLAEQRLHKLNHGALGRVPGEPPGLEGDVVLLLLLICEAGRGAEPKTVLDDGEGLPVAVLLALHEVGGVSLLSVEPEVLQRHDVLRQRPGLVGGDYVGGAQGLHRLQVLHKDLLLRHALSGQGQGHGHGGEQSFRDVGHDYPDGEHHVIERVKAQNEPEHEEQHAEEDGNGGDDLDEVVNFSIDGSLPALARLGS